MASPIFDAATGVNQSWLDAENAAKAFWDSEEWIASTSNFLAGGTGTFTVTGGAAVFTVARQMAGATGSFALTGDSAFLTLAWHLLGGTGIFIYTGNPAANPPTTAVISPTVTGFGQSTLPGGRPFKRKPKKTDWPGDEIEEDELEEIMAMLGIDL